MAKRYNYEWKTRHWSAGVKADVAGPALRKMMEDRKGKLQPQDVVNEARDDGHPLHPCFEWDDSVAAEAYRCEQAGGIIRNIIITPEDPDAEDVEVRAFVSIHEEDNRFYVPTEAALAKPETREQVLKDALDQLLAWKKRYSDLQEFAALIPVVEKAAKKVRRTIKKGDAAHV